MVRGVLFHRSSTLQRMNDPISGNHRLQSMTPSSSSRRFAFIHGGGGNCSCASRDERFQLLRMLFLAGMIALLLHSIEFDSPNQDGLLLLEQESLVKKTVSISDVAEKYEQQCAGAPTTTQQQTNDNTQSTSTSKPFWVPSYPNSDMGIFKDLVIRLTGDSTGAKSYYAQSKTFKKCFGNTRTITCEMIHPIVAIGPPPEQQTSKFQNKIILPIRNPITLFPAHHQSKAEQYHGATSQVNISEWRLVRDEFYQKSLEEWKNLIQTWKSMPGYDGGIALYVVYERFFDAATGPSQVQALGELLQSASFSLQDSSFECIWFKSMQHRKPYAHNQYRPSFRKEQIQYIIEFLQQMQTEFASDTQLVEILNEYILEAKQLPPDTE